MLPDLKEPPLHTVDWLHDLLVVVPMRNCVQYVGYCMASLQGQSAPFRAIVLDDCSTDGTFERTQELIGNDPRFTLVHNEARRGALANISEGIRALDPKTEDVVVTLDGDDWFVDRRALSYVIENYARSPHLRMTYGQFVHASTAAPGLCARYPHNVVISRSYRRHKWLASHLRTFRAELWNKIRPKDLIDPRTGRHWEMTWDLAMMFPMLEMCSPDEALFIERNLYVYNDCNPRNDNKVDAKLQRNIEAIVRSMRPYERTP